MSDRRHDLGESELEVLKTLWDSGPLTVRAVMNELHKRGRRVAYTTVLTFLTRLEQKGCVASDKSGQAYVYRPLITHSSVTQNRLKALLQQLYDGAAGPLVLQLVRSQELTRDEIEELQLLIDRLDGETGGRKSD
jgi:predicted transcriptional regulator